VVTPLWYIGLLGVPRAVRIWGSLDEDLWPAITFRGGFIGVFCGCGVFFILGDCTIFEGILECVVGMFRSRRQRPGTTELLHVSSWFRTSRCSYKKCHSVQYKCFICKTGTHQRSVGGIHNIYCTFASALMQCNNLHKPINQHWNINLYFQSQLHLYGIVLWHNNSYTFHTEYE
jgi:hypothetical protein